MKFLFLVILFVNASAFKNDSFSYDDVIFSVYYSRNFTLDQEVLALDIARKARKKHNLNFTKLSLYMRDHYDYKFGKYWNCFAGVSGNGDTAGWRAARYIEMIALSSEKQFFHCFQGCNNDGWCENTRE